MGNWWRCGFCLGAGVAVGAVAAILLSRNSSTIRKGMASVLSHGLDLKAKAKCAVSTAKENLDDIAAEAKQASNKRRSAKA